MLIQLSNNNGAELDDDGDLEPEPRHRGSSTSTASASSSRSTSQMKVRFIASDFGTGQVIEAGVDSFVVEVCPTAPYLGVAGVGNVGARPSADRSTC